MLDANLILLVLLFLIIGSIVPLTFFAVGAFIYSIYDDYRKKRFYSLKIYLTVVGIMVGIVAILILATLPPSEKKLIDNYNENKTAFHALAQRIQEDQKKGLERIDDTWTRPENVNTIGLNGQDIANYRRDLKKLDIERGFYAYPDTIEFMAHASGLAVSGSSIGYVYTTVTPQNYFKEDCGYSLEPFKNIRDYKGCNGYTQSYKIYQQIDKNWYLYEELED